MAGTHPFTLWEDVEVSPGARYQFLYASLRELARREPTFGLHVHVAVPHPEQALRAYNRVRAHLPMLLALSGNSPFWQGRDTGLCSMRTPLFQAFPRVGIPREFRSYADYVEGIDVLLRCDAFPEPTFLWWDVRLQPRFGTVEVRVMDAQTRVADTAALVALVQCLVRLEALEDHAGHRLVTSPEVLEENRFVAARDGMAAQLIDPSREGRRPARRVARRAARGVRAARRRPRLRRRAPVGARARGGHRRGAPALARRTRRGAAARAADARAARRVHLHALRARPPHRLMCGIAGELRRGAAPDREALLRMSAALAPRGPDGDGLWLDGDAGLAHRRLAIIDLSERGAQPMVDEALGLTIVFNGIIYNHRELRAELETAGHAFRSHADTEVLLKGWAEWGEAVLDRLAGMFAFCLVEHALGARGAGARPARQEAAVPAGAAGRRAAAGVVAARAAGGGRGRHEHRPGRAAPLPVVPLDRAGAADDPHRRAQAPARHRAGGRAGRPAARAALLGPAVRARSGARGLVGSGTGTTRCSRR